MLNQSGEIKILELFSGYGTASFALKRLGIHYECVGYSDIDKYANKTFRQNHSGKELGDVKKIDPNQLEDFDLLTGGFPCQAFSNAGKRLGEEDPRGTLFYEIIRIAEVKKPRYMLLENVKGLTSKKFEGTFNKILSELDRIGYKVHWKILNTKDYGIPQSRARVWFVCFNKEKCSQLEIQDFKWPEQEELKIFMKDILEENVDEKYFLNDNFVKRLLESSDVLKKFSALNPEIAIAETARQYANWKGNFILTGLQKHQQIKTDGICNCLPSAMGEGGGHTPMIAAMRSYPRTGKKEIDVERHQNLEPREDGCSNTITSVQKDNIVVIGSLDTEGWEKRFEEIRRVYSPEGISPTLPTATVGGHIPKFMQYFRIRRLTPKECFRLQGFLNDEIDLTGLSDTQCYKLAGNGQSVNVVEKIFKEMFNMTLQLNYNNKTETFK